MMIINKELKSKQENGGIWNQFQSQICPFLNYVNVLEGRQGGKEEAREG